MKLLIVHDAQGEIISIGTPGDASPSRVGAHAGSGTWVIETQRPDLEGTERSKYLRELAEQFRVDVRTGELTRK